MNYLPAVTLCLLIAGCGESPPSAQHQGQAAEPAAEPAPAPAPVDSASGTAPIPGHGTVTKTLGGAAVEPQDRGQEPSAGDLAITAAVRKAIMDDGTLSAQAKEVRVSTTNGKIILRGSVASPAERSRIEALARNASGINAAIDDMIDAGPQH